MPMTMRERKIVHSALRANDCLSFHLSHHFLYKCCWTASLLFSKINIYAKSVIGCVLFDFLLKQFQQYNRLITGMSSTVTTHSYIDVYLFNPLIKREIAVDFLIFNERIKTFKNNGRHHNILNVHSPSTYFQNCRELVSKIVHCICKGNCCECHKGSFVSVLHIFPKTWNICVSLYYHIIMIKKQTFKILLNCH